MCCACWQCVISKLLEDGADSLARNIRVLSDVGTRAAGSVSSVRRETGHKLARETGGQPFHMKVSPCCPSLGQQAVGRARACCILWDAVMQLPAHTESVYPGRCASQPSPANSSYHLRHQLPG